MDISRCHLDQKYEGKRKAVTGKEVEETEKIRGKGK
jgi:hypothetical protein